MIQNNSKGQLTAQVNLGEKVRSGFRFDYPFRGTGRLGRIYNTRKTHVYPSDKIEGKSIAALQFEPLAVPILANMYVHQEHFYVPENTLWENFDKFISGGVNMDYQGKKPSKSLAEMFTSFLTIVDRDDDTLPYIIPLYRGTQSNDKPEDLYISRLDIEKLENYVLPDGVKAILEQYQMLDLYDYVVDVVRECGLALQAISNTENEDVDYTSGDVRLFTLGHLTSSIDERYNKVVYNEDNPNEYLRKIAKSVVVAYDGADNGNGLNYIIPTDAGMIFLRYMYEVIKPYFGYSSYLDQMSYNKLSFDNFVYISVLSFIRFGNLATAENIFYGFRNFIDWLSDKPEDILPLRAQYSVWWNNYRDQLLEVDAPEPIITDAVTDLEVFTLLAPRVRCWHKDGFTTALDNPGTGNVQVPINSLFFENALGPVASGAMSGNPMSFKFNNVGDDEGMTQILSDGNNIAEIKLNAYGAEHSWKIPTAYLTGINPLVSSEDMEDLRMTGFSLYALDAAKRAQKWLQKALFYGNRIQDFLYTHFGVKYLDARLRLPELLATSKQLVKLTDVINNTNVVSGEDTVAVAGDRAAIAYAYDETGGYIDRYCEEWGYIISNLTVMPDVTYANGFDRDLAALDQFDYPFPEFATLGMDAVYDVELAQVPVKIAMSDSDYTMTDQPNVFGYQGRYYNHKSHLGEEHGELLDTQDMYTFARDFNIYDPDSRPKLNYIFVHCHPVLDMFVVDNKYSDYFRYDIFFNAGLDRPFPAHSLVI